MKVELMKVLRWLGHWARVVGVIGGLTVLFGTGCPSESASEGTDTISEASAVENSDGAESAGLINELEVEKASAEQAARIVVDEAMTELEALTKEIDSDIE